MRSTSGDGRFDTLGFKAAAATMLASTLVGMGLGGIGRAGACMMTGAGAGRALLPQPASWPTHAAAASRHRTRARADVWSVGIRQKE
jgi:hypothetical protein